MTWHICEFCKGRYNCGMGDDCKVHEGEPYGWCSYDCHAKQDGRPTLAQLQERVVEK